MIVQSFTQRTDDRTTRLTVTSETWSPIISSYSFLPSSQMTARPRWQAESHLAVFNFKSLGVAHFSIIRIEALSKGRMGKPITGDALPPGLDKKEPSAW